MPACFGNTCRSAPATFSKLDLLNLFGNGGGTGTAPAPGNPSRLYHKRVCIFGKRVLSLNDYLCKHVCIYTHPSCTLTSPQSAFPFLKAATLLHFNKPTSAAQNTASPFKFPTKTIFFFSRGYRFSFQFRCRCAAPTPRTGARVCDDACVHTRG